MYFPKDDMHSFQLSELFILSIYGVTDYQWIVTYVSLNIK